jgi:predicted transposase/invertase (TIGR01784 family)
MQMMTKYLNPKNDFAFKKIFGSETHKNILIHFLNDILLFTGRNQIETVKFLSPSINPETWAQKQSIVDVLCKDQKGLYSLLKCR